jgi:ABC-type oligopeptide transport system ATPase subunit
MRKPRVFTAVDPATITRPEVFAVGLYGYTGTGKTKSALELATGIIRVYGGELFFADADGGRGLHFRKQYPQMRYIDFDGSKNALDFADLIEAHEGKRGVLVIDPMSQEHDGENGLLDTHEVEKRGDEKRNPIAWAVAKEQHKKLARVVRRAIQSIPLVICWRAQDKTDWNNRDENGKLKPAPLGEMPIGSMDLPFEMTATYLFPVGSRGVPCLRPEARGEQLMTKIPDQFVDIIRPGEQIGAAHGEAMARWAMLPTLPKALSEAAEAMRTRLASVQAPADLEAVGRDFGAQFPKGHRERAALAGAFKDAQLRAERSRVEPEPERGEAGA